MARKKQAATESIGLDEAQALKIYTKLVQIR